MSFKIVGIGEVLWDLLPNGQQLGGAPSNFAYHARMLGANAKIVTRVGKDALGHEILRRFDEIGIAEGVVQVDDHAPTGTATVLLKVGVPVFRIHEDVAWDRLALTDAALKAVHDADAICFGSMAQRSHSASLVIQGLVAAAPTKSLRVFDINLRQNYYSKDVLERSLRLANVLKLNDQELAILASIFGLPDGPIQRQIEKLATQFDFEVLALTRGDKGSLLYKKGRWSDLPGSSVRVVDTVGAGDSFTAALVMGLLCGMSLEQTHRIAADVADYVCTCAGATPSLPGHFREQFNLISRAGLSSNPLHDPPPIRI